MRLEPSQLENDNKENEMAIATGFWGCARFGNRIGMFLVTARYATATDVVTWFATTSEAMDECGRRNRN